ncbi:MAG: prepilin peptidase [Thermodesulfovibrio sp.]|nr:prepilin peptidase [Thermodesulfovibrio sp.]
MNLFELIFLIFGLIVGSFLNVCIYRIPRNISIISPSSSCPSCGTLIKPQDNIPLISYLILKGRCKKCGGKISMRYPLVELLNGILYWSVFKYFGMGWHLLFLFAFVSAMIVIIFIDSEFQLIPDLITIPGFVIGILGASFIIPDPFVHSSFYPFTGISIVGFLNSAAGMLLGGGLFYLIAVVSKGGMGGGDIKMMAMVGAFMGWKAVLLTTFIGSLTGSLVGIFLMVFKGKDRKTKIPFGPFLSLGAIITLFFGGSILRWYFNI